MSADSGQPLDSSPVEATGQRVCDPDWSIDQAARRRYVGPWQRVLNLFCGDGAAAVRLARIGYDVDAVDADERAVGRALELARRHGLSDRCRPRVCVGGRLDFGDRTFDIVVGLAGLPTLNLKPLAREIERVLKPGGIAMIKCRFRSVTPSQPQSAHGVGPRESSILGPIDLDILRQVFRTVQAHDFSLTGRLGRLAPACSARQRQRLGELDARLRSVCPQLAPLGDTVMLVLQKTATVPAAHRHAA